MLKVKKIRLNGFRGMLKLQELDLTSKGENKPRSLVLYGLNSSGKTSFVDGLEWFLSERNQIEWLQREDAKERAYPHQEAKEGESFVEIEFYDTETKIGTLTKTFNHKRITQPGLSPEEGFKAIYKAFVIRPHLRYLEVIDFIYNRTGVEKYQKLASWMGFESELDFQEKIALGIVPELKKKGKRLSENVELFEKQLKLLIGGQQITEMEVVSFCNNILKTYNISTSTKVVDLWKHILEISKLKISSPLGVKVDKLTEAETSLSKIIFDSDLASEIQKVREQINELRKEQKLIEKIDVINLYTQALDVLNKTTDSKTKCPVCGIEWERKKLLTHIKEELLLLKKVKEDRDNVTRDISDIKELLRKEQEVVRSLITKYEEVKKTIPDLVYEIIKKYQINLNSLEMLLAGNVFIKNIENTITKQDAVKITNEKEEIINQIKSEKLKIQPSKAELKMSEDIEKLNQVKEKWHSILEAKAELDFTNKEINKFINLSNELIRLIQESIKSRFGETSECIGKYFSTLRNDKDIKDIEIILNEERGRAAGRSAEIQLKYYDISVKPAYKVLSESLLNSLGLAVYFTCVKQFNAKCKFIVLDDIMNSLDIDNRDTILDLIEQEFSDFQIILLTHDFYWFQKTIRRFPQWISKKIKGWDYAIGSKIDFAKTTKEEVEELLADSTTIEDAGFKFGRHIEGILNELCENLWAVVRHRYTKNEPPTMEELFDSLYKRLKDKTREHPVVQKVLNAKKYEPLIRNFTGHPRSNYAASISPTEVKRAIQEWFDLEQELRCSNCRRYVEYHKTKDSIECRCGEKKLKKVVAGEGKKK